MHIKLLSNIQLPSKLRGNSPMKFSSNCPMKCSSFTLELAQKTFLEGKQEANNNDYFSF